MYILYAWNHNVLLYLTFVFTSYVLSYHLKQVTTQNLLTLECDTCFYSTSLKYWRVIKNTILVTVLRAKHQGIWEKLTCKFLILTTWTIKKWKKNLKKIMWVKTSLFWGTLICIKSDAKHFNNCTICL